MIYNGDLNCFCITEKRELYYFVVLKVNKIHFKSIYFPFHEGFNYHYRVIERKFRLFLKKKGTLHSAFRHSVNSFLVNEYVNRSILITARSAERAWRSPRTTRIT